MMQASGSKVAFACAYTPLPLIRAAGFVPYRLLPMGDWPDRAGRLLHDNLCPHVKRIVDRGLHGDLPEVAGLVLMNSCDAMRRLADGWKKIRPSDPVHLVDLPVSLDGSSSSFFRGELERLAEVLVLWGGENPDRERLSASIESHDRLAACLERLQERHRRGRLNEGSAGLQKIYNRASTEPVESVLAEVERRLSEPETSEAAGAQVPVFLFGNVLPDPEAFSLFESLGARIVREDLCTGSRLFQPLGLEGSGDILGQLSRALLGRRACARTLDPTRPGGLAEDISEQAAGCGAKGVIGHTVKFCDPYLARMSGVRERLGKAGIPFLLLEGDCTLRSIGQHKTRIEAFVEMLKSR